MHKYTYMAF